MFVCVAYLLKELMWTGSKSSLLYIFGIHLLVCMQMFCKHVFFILASSTLTYTRYLRMTNDLRDLDS